MKKKWPIETPFQDKLWKLIDKTMQGKWSVFSRKAKISPGAFQNYLEGKAKPKQDALRKICKLGRVDESYFDEHNNENDKLFKVSDTKHGYGLPVLNIEDRNLIEKAHEIITSKTAYKKILADSINSLYKAMKDDDKKESIGNPKDENTEKKIM